MITTTDNRPAYVQRIDRERLMAEAERDAILEGLNELRAYLNSPKFRSLEARQLGNYVNVDDVLLRLNETTYAGVCAADAATR